MFREPYNSTEIGFHRVGALSLDPHVNTPEDIHNKCLIIPEAVKPGTTNDPDESFGVLKYLIPRNLVGPLRILSPVERAIKMQEEYDNAFTGVDMPTWGIISIMRPGSDY